jgi:hypothetical protein
VLQHHLQPDGGLLVDALLESLLLGDVDAAQALLQHVELFLRNLLRGETRIFRFGVGDDLVKLLLIVGTLKNSSTSLSVMSGLGLITLATLLFEVVLGDHAGALKLELALHVFSLVDAVSLRFLGNGEKPAHVLREVFARALVSGEALSHLRRLIFRDQGHVFRREFDRSALSRLTCQKIKPGEDDGDGACDECFAC